MKKIFDGSYINYWLGYGTALGIYRDGQIIPWDADADVGYLASDSYKVFSTYEDFKNTDFELYYTNGHYAIRDKKTKRHLICLLPHKKSESLCHWIEFIPPLTYWLFALASSTYSKKEYKYKDDVAKQFVLPHMIGKILVTFASFLATRGKIRIVKGVFRIQLLFKLYKKNIIRLTPIDCVTNLSKIKAYGEEFTIPSDTEKYLESIFGKDWKIPKYYTKNEKGEKIWMK